MAFCLISLSNDGRFNITDEGRDSVYIENSTKGFEFDQQEGILSVVKAAAAGVAAVGTVNGAVEGRTELVVCVVVQERRLRETLTGGCGEQIRSEW